MKQILTLCEQMQNNLLESHVPTPTVGQKTTNLLGITLPEPVTQKEVFVGADRVIDEFIRHKARYKGQEDKYIILSKPFFAHIANEHLHTLRILNQQCQTTHFGVYWTTLTIPPELNEEIRAYRRLGNIDGKSFKTVCREQGVVHNQLFWSLSPMILSFILVCIWFIIPNDKLMYISGIVTMFSTFICLYLAWRWLRHDSKSESYLEKQYDLLINGVLNNKEVLAEKIFRNNTDESMTFTVPQGNTIKVMCVPKIELEEKKLKELLQKIAGAITNNKRARPFLLTSATLPWKFAPIDTKEYPCGFSYSIAGIGIEYPDMLVFYRDWPVEEAVFNEEFWRAQLGDTIERKGFDMFKDPEDEIDM